jgi:hypothetical protein
MMNVESVGAVGDGVADDAPAIQRALDQHRKIFIPFGHYKIGRTLRVHSGTRLSVHPHAVLKLADGVGQHWDDFLLTCADSEGGVRDVEISGGIWDGNQAANRRGLELINPGAYSGVLLNFFNVDGLVLREMTLANAESYFLRLCEVKHFLVEHICFHSDEPRPNNDGVNLGGGCEHGVIRHLRGLTPGTPNDDMVALNADDMLERIEIYGKVCGPIRHINIYDIEAVRCHSFVRLLSVDSPIEHITIDNVRGGCDISAINMDAARGCRIPLFDQNDPARASGVGAVSNVWASRFFVHKTEPNQVPLLRLETRAGMVVTDFRRNLKADVDLAAPTAQIRHIEGHTMEMEGLSETQKTSIQQASSAQVAVTSDGQRHNIHTVLSRGESMVLPQGDFARLTMR